MHMGMYALLQIRSWKNGAKKRERFLVSKVEFNFFLLPVE